MNLNIYKTLGKYTISFNYICIYINNHIGMYSLTIIYTNVLNVVIYLEHVRFINMTYTHFTHLIYELLSIFYLYIYYINSYKFNSSILFKT